MEEALEEGIINQDRDQFGSSFMYEAVMNVLTVAMTMKNEKKGFDWGFY